MQYLYYDDDSSSASDEDVPQLTGGVRPMAYLDNGNNANSTPLHMAETMGIASAGKLKIGKTLKKIGKSVGKEIYNTAKPIVIEEGRNMLKQGIQSLLQPTPTATPTAEGGRRRGRPRKMILLDDCAAGGKMNVGKTLKAIGKSPVTKKITDEVIHQAVQAGIAYASGAGFDRSAQYEVGTSGGKIKIGKIISKVAKNPIVKQVGQEAVHQGVQAGLEALVGAGKGRSHRAGIVKQVMKEHGLSLPMASRYVKEHGLY
jgi:hypothetical protein